MLAVADVRVGAGGFQEPRDIRVSHHDGQMERRHLGIPVGPEGVGLGAVREQPLDGGKVALPGHEVQRSRRGRTGAEELLRAGPPAAGALHLMARQGNVPAVEWLLTHGADPNALWAHWDADVTPLHLAVMMGHADVVRRLLAAGADPRIRDSKHGGDAFGWAEHFGRTEIMELLAHA